MSSRARRWATLTLCLASACVEKTPMAPGPAVIAVHAILNPAQSVQHAYVVRTATGSGIGQPVSGASVSLVTPDGATIAATEVQPARVAPFYASPGPQYDIATNTVSVGRPYRLRVLMPTGEMVEGETTAPAVAPATIVTERRLDRAVDTLRLSWPRVPGARAYEVRVGAKPDSIFFGEAYVTYVDTSFTLPGTATSRGLRIFNEGIRYDLVVSAVDANYYDYYAFDSDQYTGTSLPTSLRGAVGVFGSLVPIVRMTIAVDGIDPRQR